MPVVIIAGLPPDYNRRVKAALKEAPVFPEMWQVHWIPSKNRTPGLALSQCNAALQTAENNRGAHFFIFRGHEKHIDRDVESNIKPYFRLRWLEQKLLGLIWQRMDELFNEINQILEEEWEWIETVKPRDQSSCLLLPECAFVAAPAVQHLWDAATKPTLERIRLAARVRQQFETQHWRPSGDQIRNWTDDEKKVFDHRGEHHGIAPFPRSWKFCYRVINGFHYDVTSKDSRPFHVDEMNGRRHSCLADGHINIDPHGYVRSAP